MIGTTHFTNALIERRRLDRDGIIRLASPSGDALPPLTAWPDALARQVGGEIFLLPGGSEVDGRDIALFDEDRMRTAVLACRAQGIDRLAVGSDCGSINVATTEEHPLG